MYTGRLILRVLGQQTPLRNNPVVPVKKTGHKRYIRVRCGLRRVRGCDRGGRIKKRVQDHTPGRLLQGRRPGGHREDQVVGHRRQRRHCELESGAGHDRGQGSETRAGDEARHGD